MNPTERLDDPQHAVRTAILGALSTVWTALPAIVVSFDPVAITAVLQPTVKALVTREDDTTVAVTMPLLPDVPVVFPRGGGATLTFPIKPGDECLVVFAARAIDAWWQSGGVQLPNEARQHDLSDGFAIPGPFSQAQRIGNLNTSAVQLRSNDGAAFFELNPITHHLRIVAPGGLDIVADITHEGDTQQTGSQHSTGDIVAGSISLEGHIHGGVKAGPDDSGPPQ